MKIDFNKKKVQAGYKTLYFDVDLMEFINKIEKENNISFNNVVVTIIKNYMKKEAKT